MAEGRGDEVGEIVAAWHRERPHDDVSSILVVTPIWRLASALRRAGTPYRLTAGELTRRCRVTPGATTQRVQRLEQEAYVERVRDGHDRRTVHIALTPGGSAKLDEVFAAVMEADEAVLAPLTARDRASLARILGGWLSSAGLDATTPA
jgi:DNA-binding MarR family transcriptional regulator